MDLETLEQQLAGALRSKPPGGGLGHSRRLRALALQIAAHERDSDRREVELLALLAPLRGDIRTQRSVRGTLEAAAVEAGWSQPRIRDLLRTLEARPPRSINAQVVADAETLLGLGMAGFARAVAAEAGDLKPVRPRLFTRQGRLLAGPLRQRYEELRHELLEALGDHPL